MSAPIYPPTIPTIPPPTPKQRKRWPYIAAIPVAFVLGIGAGRAGDANTAPAQPTATAPAVVQPNPYLPNAGGSLPAVPAPTYADARDNPAVPDPYVNAQPQPTGPLTVFADGIYEVGTGDGQVAPGKYKSDNPDGTGSVFVKTSTGHYTDYAVGKDQLIVTITKADAQVDVKNATFAKM